MVDNAIYTIISEAIKTLFLIGIPVVVFVTLSGLLVSVAQTATSITDSGIGYAARLAAFLIVLYLFLPSFAQRIMTLAESAFR